VHSLSLSLRYSLSSLSLSLSLPVRSLHGSVGERRERGGRVWKARAWRARAARTSGGRRGRAVAGELASSGRGQHASAEAGERAADDELVAAESPSLVLVINDTKLLMSYVKCFELGISNTCDEGVCGKEWWP
jgi:hypothetical protein